MKPLLDQDPRRAVARLALAIMAADGRITPPEVEALGRFEALGLGGIDLLIEEELERACREPIDLTATCAALAGTSPQVVALLLGVLAEIAVSDGVLTDRERETYETIGRLLGIDAEQSAHLLAIAMDAPGVEGTADVPTDDGGSAARRIPVDDGAETVSAARAPAAGSGAAGATPSPARASAREAGTLVTHARLVLGVAPGASREAVDAAYAALVERYNPATVLGMGTEFAALATRRLAEATAAWEIVLASSARGA